MDDWTEWVDGDPSKAHERVNELMRRVNADDADPQTVDLFQKLLSRVPSLWQKYGDMTKIAREQMLDYVTHEQATRMMIQRALDGHVEELGYHSATPLERLLIDHLQVCWLDFYEVKRRHAQVNAQSDNTSRYIEHWDRRLTQAQNRYLKSIDMLARIRRMLTPVAQVNVGVNQVNVARGVGN